MTKIEDYVKEVPEEIRHAIRGLDSDYRTAIFVALYKHGELSFSELQKTLKIDKAMLNYHLGKLIESALIHHYYKHELGTEKYSFYNVTPFGQNFVEILSEFLTPQPCLIPPLKETSATSGVFIIGWDIIAQRMNISKTKNLEEIADWIDAKYVRGGRKTRTWFAADDTNIGSLPRDIIQVEEESRIEKRSALPAAI